MAIPKAPKGLGAAARKVWRDTAGKYVLEANELLTLEDYCRERDTIERLQGEMDALPSLEVEGSQHQPVTHEHVKEIRQHRLTAGRLWKDLNLPADQEAVTETRSTQARAAAMARWGRRGTA